MPKQDESLVDEMRAALQGDLERSRLRNGAAPEQPAPEQPAPERLHEPQADEASSRRRRLFFRRK
jgi:hypothetical protein